MLAELFENVITTRPLRQLEGLLLIPRIYSAAPQIYWTGFTRDNRICSIVTQRLLSARLIRSLMIKRNAYVTTASEGAKIRKFSRKKKQEQSKASGETRTAGLPHTQTPTNFFLEHSLYSLIKVNHRGVFSAVFTDWHKKSHFPLDLAEAGYTTKALEVIIF